MGQQNKGQTGRWVFRNQRWQYLPPDYDDLVPPPRQLDAMALQRLVDIEDLWAAIRTGQRLFAQPILLALNRAADGGGPHLDTSGPEWPAWWPKLETLLPGASAAAQEDMLAAARRVTSNPGPSVHDGLLGTDSIYCLPIALRSDGLYRLVAVLVLMAGTEEHQVAADELRTRFAVDDAVAREAADLLASMARPLDRTQPLWSLLESHVRVHETRLQEAYLARIDKTTLQARIHQLLVRTQALERQLFHGTAEITKVEDDGIPMKELAAILDNPRIGVTVEDTSHRVRYQNPMLREAFGNQVGRLCYQAFKGRTEPCRPCPITAIWDNGDESVRYTTRDPRSGRSFEIFAFPMVGEDGDKLIVEVGIDVSDLVARNADLRAAAHDLQHRADEMGHLLSDLSRILHGNCAAVSTLVDAASPPEASVASGMATRFAATGRLTAALSLPHGNGAADMTGALERVVKGLTEEGLSLPDIRQSVMPGLPLAPQQLDALLEGLLRALVDVRPAVPNWVVSHTMSGQRDALTKGDRFHLLTLFAEEDDNAPVSATPVLQGEAHGIDVDANLDLALAAMMARKLGGFMWRQVVDQSPVTYCLTLPVSADS